VIETGRLGVEQDPTAKISDQDARKAAADFEHEQKRRDAERRRKEAARERERAKRTKLVAKAQATLDAAQREHEERVSTLDAQRTAVEKRLQVEDAGWESEKETLKDALRRARE
jgi:hypothetical protein